MLLRRLSWQLLLTAGIGAAVTTPVGAQGLVDRGIQAAVGSAHSLRDWATTGVQTAEATQAWRAFGRNDRGAFDRLVELARAGNADAQNYVGHILAEGLDRRRGKDPDEAARWFAASAQRGSVVALYNLAIMQTKGEGVQFDERQAMNAFNGVKGQIPEAAVHLALHHYRRNEFSLAWQNAHHAAVRGDPMGMYIAGKMLHEGTAPSSSHRQMRNLLRDAAKAHIADAAWLLGVSYDDASFEADHVMLSRAYRLISIGIDRAGAKHTPSIVAGLSDQEARRAQTYATNWFKRFPRPAAKSYMTTMAEVPPVSPPRTY